MISRLLQKTGVVEARFKLLLEAEKRLSSERNVSIPEVNTPYRISGLARMCPREQVLRARHRVPKREIIDARLRRTFDVGHAFHSLIQNEWFGEWGWLWGEWKCGHCPRVVLGFRPRQCECGHPAEFRYVEPVIFDSEHNLTGHCDGIIQWGGKKYVVEFKTCNSQVFQFMIRNNPMSDHLDQVNLYMHYLNVAQGFVVYFCKEDASWREFEVRYDRVRVDGLLKKIRVTNAALADPQIPVPPREMCSTDTCSRAKVCSTRKLCFSK